jgi:hypothetical protein
MLAKAAVENVSMESYEIGNENVTFTDADPETNQQLQLWAKMVASGLAEASAGRSHDVSFTNTSGYVG